MNSTRRRQHPFTNCTMLLMVFTSIVALAEGVETKDPLIGENPPSEKNAKASMPPTPFPTKNTKIPKGTSTFAPIISPTMKPTIKPSWMSLLPSGSPSKPLHITTSHPSSSTSTRNLPSWFTSKNPSQQSSSIPSNTRSTFPTKQPSHSPTFDNVPFINPASIPSEEAGKSSIQPTENPSQSASPSMKPSQAPSVSSTVGKEEVGPSNQPSDDRISYPSLVSSNFPSISRIVRPSPSPSYSLLPSTIQLKDTMGPPSAYNELPSYYPSLAPSSNDDVPSNFPPISAIGPPSPSPTYSLRTTEPSIRLKDTKGPSAYNALPSYYPSLAPSSTDKFYEHIGIDENYTEMISFDSYEITTINPGKNLLLMTLGVCLCCIVIAYSALPGKCMNRHIYQRFKRICKGRTRKVKNSFSSCCDQTSTSEKLDVIDCLETGFQNNPRIKSVETGVRKVDDNSAVTKQQVWKETKKIIGLGTP